MPRPLTYRSFSFSPFNAWRIVFFGFLLPSLLLLLVSESWIYFLAFGLVSLIAVTVYIVQSYSVILIEGNKLLLKNFYKAIQINGVTEIDTWWSYNFSMPSPEMGAEGATGKTNGVANKINCYVKFTGKDETAYIFEQIYISDKFPNNHPYNYEAQIDSSKVIKVWDIDKCLRRLNLD